ncbi:Nucleotidyltransferase domain protein [uncultured archaeon]|nr:Nucleotidyltransferase domain protein [uncultured archaeon]
MQAERMDVIEILKGHEQEIKERFGIRRIGVFGSFARGEQKETSDVDILAEFDKPTFDNFMDLAFFLEDLFQLRVDLATPNSLSPYIGPYVKKEVVWAD